MESEKVITSPWCPNQASSTEWFWSFDRKMCQELRQAGIWAEEACVLGN